MIDVRQIIRFYSRNGTYKDLFYLKQPKKFGISPRMPGSTNTPLHKANRHVKPWVAPLLLWRNCKWLLKQVNNDICNMFSIGFVMLLMLSISGADPENVESGAQTV